MVGSFKGIHLSNMAMFGIYVKFQGRYFPPSLKIYSSVFLFFWWRWKEHLAFWGWTFSWRFLHWRPFLSELWNDEIAAKRAEWRYLFENELFFSKFHKNDIFWSPEDLLNLLFLKQLGHGKTIQKMVLWNLDFKKFGHLSNEKRAPYCWVYY